MAGIINARKGGVIKKGVKKVSKALISRSPIGAVASVVKTGKKLIKGGAKAISGKGYKKHKRMNVANVRALKRAIKRVKGFAKVSQQSINISKRVKVRRKR